MRIFTTFLFLIPTIHNLIAHRRNVFNRTMPPVHDPAAVLPSLRADPHIGMVCQICDTAGDDDKILLCDKCDKGFHMYCLRPVMVNIPVGEVRRSEQASICCS